MCSVSIKHLGSFISMAHNKYLSHSLRSFTKERQFLLIFFWISSPSYTQIDTNPWHFSTLSTCEFVNLHSILHCITLNLNPNTTNVKWSLKELEKLGIKFACISTKREDLLLNNFGQRPKNTQVQLAMVGFAERVQWSLWREITKS